MVKAGDVKALSEIFQKAANWGTREWAVVALERIIIERIRYDRDEMIEALNEIVQVCEAEKTGGTYRTNCLEIANRLLQRLTATPGETPVTPKVPVPVKPESVSKKPSRRGRCDVCDKEMNFEDGYILTTTQVTTSEAYWEFAFTHQWSYIHSFDPEGNTIAMLVRQQGGQRTGWLLCESCIRLFNVDRNAAKEYTRSALNLADPGKYIPPGGGPANIQAVALAAAKAWKKLYGKPPQSIKILGEELPAQKKAVVPEGGRPAESLVSAMFVFNSDEISDEVSSTYGAYAQGEILKALSRGLKPLGGWGACPPLMLCCHGDLFEKSVMGEIPSLIVLSNWIKRGLYGIDVKYLDSDIVRRVKANQSLDYIPYIVGIGPIPKSYAIIAHNELNAKGVIGYLGLFTLTGVDIPRLDSLLYLPLSMKITGRKCVGGMVRDDDLREAGLVRTQHGNV